MRFPPWSSAWRRAITCQLLASVFLLMAARCPAQVAGRGSSDGQSNPTQTTVLSDKSAAPSDATTMRAVASVPLPESWKKQGRVECSKDGDLLFQPAPGNAEEMPGHEIARAGANGASLGYFDLRQTPGFETAIIHQTAFDSAGRIVLLVSNLVPFAETERHPPNIFFHWDRTRWVLTIDNNGKLLSKFSFQNRLVTGEHFALFKNGNVLVTGYQGAVRPGIVPDALGVIFSPDGTLLAKVKLPDPAGDVPDANEGQQLTAGNERSAAQAQPVQASGSGPGTDGSAAKMTRGPKPGSSAWMGANTPLPIAGSDDEIYLMRGNDQRFLWEVSADGTLGPTVKLAIPEDERPRIMKIAGHRALARISSAQGLPPGFRTTIDKMPISVPLAVFDTESGALLDMLLLSRNEGIVCYSGSGIKAIRSPEGILDTLQK